MSEEDQTSATISLQTSEDSATLLAIVPPASQGLAAMQAPQLGQMLRERGYGDWLLDEAQIQAACAAIGKHEEEKRFEVARRLDGEVEISVENHDMEAYMQITPAYGGAPIERHHVLKALNEKGITHGIKQEAITVDSTEKILIAQGEPPVDGDDAVFESLLPDVQDKRPKINDDGSVDYFEIGAFVTVSAGDSLMRRLPPTDGINGTDVFGKVITAKPGKTLEFATRMEGVKIDPNDKDVLIATNGGQPEIIERGMSVNPVMSLKSVGLETGNINFEGTVNVSGDVHEGAKIFASGDILISGMAEGAEIRAQGNIVITKGVIGRGNIHENDGKPGTGIAQLTSGGSIEARFIENAIVFAGKNITVNELVSHSELTAANCIKIGKKGAKKAHVRGGRIRATISVEAQVFGSPANIKTEVEVGNDPELRERLKKVTNEFDEAEENYQKLSTLIGRLRSQTDAKSKATLVRALNSLKETIAKIESLRKEKENLNKRNELTDSSMVVVGEHAYPGVTITIGNQSHQVPRMTEKGRFVLKDNAIELQYD
jgi:uncharacterized protein (DUF342 family)